jgi:hypothetical protein
MPVVTEIRKLSELQQKICLQCAVIWEPKAGYPTEPLCRLAILENHLGRIPTVEDTQVDGLDVSRIPVGCGNKYQATNTRAMR